MRVVNYCLGILTILVLTACHYSHTDPIESWDITNEQRDSLNFAINHHYTLNYNFTIVADSLTLRTNLPTNIPTLRTDDSMAVYQNNKIVVADIAHLKTDSTSTYWIKVARDQETIGWVPEDKLLESVVPCDPISHFIHAFSNLHFLIFFILSAITAGFYIIRKINSKRLYIVHFNDIRSFYPTLLCFFTASAATFYGSIQLFIPETWIEFYYYPTLNPFGQPFVMFLFLVNVWLMLICLLASIDDLRRQLSMSDALTYLIGLISTCLILYIFFSLTAQIYIGYPCMIAYALFAFQRYRHHIAMPYLCGNCGKPLQRLGKCPFCGVVNQSVTEKDIKHKPNSHF